MGDDLKILIAALNEALPKWAEWQKGKSLLMSYPPDNSILKPIEEAIRKCDAYCRVEGQSLFSGYSGVVLHANTLAIKLLYRGDWPRDQPDTVEKAAKWMLTVLQTKTANGFFIAPLWGLEVKDRIDLAKGLTLVPLENVPDSYAKKNLFERFHKTWDGSVWISQRYFEAPGGALLIRVENLQYIGAPSPPFEVIEALQFKTKELIEFIQASVTGEPVVTGCWFEYEDSDLDINSAENRVIWLLPEVLPHIKAHAPADPKALRELFGGFESLREELRSRLARSLERFALSQSRQKIADQVLDLALSFEIAVSGGKGDNAPPNWKVGVRSAQLIGGTLNARKETREALTELYKLRNIATHGGTFNEAQKREQRATVAKACAVYRQLITGFIALRDAPDWQTLELEPRVKE